jgi:hypothetical protein
MPPGAAAAAMVDVLAQEAKDALGTASENLSGQPMAAAMAGQVIGRHQDLFGQRPDVLAADRGFCPDAEAYAALEQQVYTLAIPRRMRYFVFAHNLVVLANQGIT